jgi:hypothetical protein
MPDWACIPRLCRDDQEKSGQILERALAASPAFVFPHRKETLTVLKWSAEQKASWITDYNAALILWHLEREEEALQLLMKWEDTPDFSPYYHTRAHLKGIQTDAAVPNIPLPWSLRKRAIPSFQATIFWTWFTASA